MHTSLQVFSLFCAVSLKNPISILKLRFVASSGIQITIPGRHKTPRRLLSVLIMSGVTVFRYR
jgi:hypothetical protein